MLNKTSWGTEKVSYCFQGHLSNFKVTQAKKFGPDFSISEKLVEGSAMMHKASRNTEEVSYYFLRSSIQFQGYNG